LKSSLMCTTAPFLGSRVPKKGFGGPCVGDAELSTAFTFGDAVDDEVPFGFGEPPGGDTDFTVGLNEDAFTFSLFAAVGLSGLATLGLWPTGAALGVGAGIALLRLPLNGGIDWMTIGILPFASSLPAAGFAAVAAFFPSAAADGFADPGGCEGAAGDARARLAEGDAVSVAVLIARACVDSASLVDFSLIWRCFSSSLARIGTKSSGMGLLSYRVSH